MLNIVLKFLTRPITIGVIFFLMVVVALYMILDIISPWDGDPCDPLICTPGYPCFEQDCAAG